MLAARFLLEAFRLAQEHEQLDSRLKQQASKE
jgi:hypothetical protein